MILECHSWRFKTSISVFNRSTIQGADDCAFPAAFIVWCKVLVLHSVRVIFSACPQDASFIERALENARKTQNESVLSSSSLCNISPELQSTSRPKPPKFSSPAFDLLGIYFRGKDQEIEQRLRPKSKPLPSALPPADEVKVKELLAKKGVISKHAREQVTDQDLFRLRPNQWLNDEIINFYGSMILARSEASKENPVINGVASGKRRPLNAHYFSTFFWSKLSGDGYEKGRLAKWTKKVSIRWMVAKSWIPCPPYLVRFIFKGCHPYTYQPP